MSSHHPSLKGLHWVSASQSRYRDPGVGVWGQPWVRARGTGGASPTIPCLLQIKAGRCVVKMEKRPSEGEPNVLNC